MLVISHKKTEAENSYEFTVFSKYLNVIKSLELKWICVLYTYKFICVLTYIYSELQNIFSKKVKIQEKYTQIHLSPLCCEPYLILYL